MKKELTKQEREVMRYIGYSYKEIAKKFCVSEGTIKRHFCNIREKFKVKSKEQFLIIALRGKYLDIDEIDAGFWLPNGEYKEDKQIIEWNKI